MPHGYQLTLEFPPGIRRSFPLTEHGLALGRNPRSDIVLADSRISWNHLRVWVDEGEVRLTDNGSRNGTRLNGTQVSGTAPASPGDVIEVAVGIALVVEVGPEPHFGARWVIEEVQTGLRYPLRGDRLVVGDSPDAHVRMASPVATIERHDDTWVLVQPGRERRVVPGEHFEIGGLELRLTREGPPRVSTVGDGSGRMLPVEVQASLDGRSSRILDPRGRELAVLPGEAQATLLWVLGQALLEDAELPEVERGWREDHTVIVRVWGRGGLETGPNRLKALVHRLRRALSSAGVDTTLIERREGRIRLRAARVQVDAT